MFLKFHYPIAELAINTPMPVYVKFTMLFSVFVSYREDGGLKGVKVSNSLTPPCIIAQRLVQVRAHPGPPSVRETMRIILST